ncbi:hypothetical protein [Streptomyces sp. NPDC019224]|uniref:hypothetical protein n=1 Tax=Streptomyces sp. NPDC019224 TaxID=3154484 RepID=UPI00340C2723
MSDPETPEQPAGSPAPNRLTQEDRHGFISAFVSGVRPAGESGRAGGRLLLVGISVVVALGLTAVVVGAFSGGGSDDKAAAHSPSASPVGRSGGPGGHASRTPDGSGGAKGGSGGAAGGSGGARGGAGGAAGGSGGATGATDATDATDATGGSGPGSTGAGSGPGPGKGSGTAANGASGAGTGPTGTAAPAASPKVQGATVAKATFTALAGYGCPSGSGATVWAADPDYDAGIDGWLRSSTGGYTGGGCSGRYVSLPMSGSAGSRDADTYFLWKFDYGSAFTSGTCTVSVYVPNHASKTYVGGSPSYYALYNSTKSGGTAAGSFSVNQVAHRGDWVRAGSWRVSGGPLTIRMVNTGTGEDRDTQHGHHAAAPIRLSCVAA